MLYGIVEQSNCSRSYSVIYIPKKVNWSKDDVNYRFVTIENDWNIKFMSPGV